RGFIEGECGFDTGLPVWFDVQNWVPWLFRIETTCGYTPVIMFGITMSESLLFISAMFLLITLAGLWASFIRK
ncbi:MAG: disulfide bond formation protein B, partial [Gammaproteobacteria bacterium]|nr:disulfide bond formation protein B [Gammaproteobacteria bacterium]